MKKNRIKSCCASCGYKTIDEDGVRTCQLMQILVSQQFRCHKWKVAKGLRNLCHNQGVIKRHEYLMFVLEVRMQEWEAVDNGILLPEDAETLDSLRKRFEAETGLSPFVIH